VRHALGSVSQFDRGVAAVELRDRPSRALALTRAPARC
jgi:hypothetical protein